MKIEIMEEVVIVGGGIVGLATAVALKRIGIKALVLERATELRTSGAALVLFPNAWLAIDALGVSHKLTSIYPLVAKGSITNVTTGAVQEITFSRKGVDMGPRPVHRKILLEALAEELPVDSIRFNSKLLAIDYQDGSSPVVVHLEDGTSIKAKILIGCDGVHSIVANWLGLAKPVHSGRSAVRGLAYYPDGHGFQYKFNQSVDVGKRGAFVPLNDKEIFWFLTFQSPLGDNISAPEQIQKEVIENHAKNFPAAYLDVVRHSDLSSLTWAPLMLRYPWNIVFGNLSKGNVTVAGDAMHPMTPDLGQGGCSALEDAVVLGRHIGQEFLRNGSSLPLDLSKALDGYTRERRWRGALLVAASYVSGWAQRDGSKWWIKLLRGSILYKLFVVSLAKIGNYDCGRLPGALGGDTNRSGYKQD